MAHNFALYLLTVLLLLDGAQFFVASNSYLNTPHFADDPFHIDPVPYPEQENCDDITARKLCGAGTSVRPISSVLRRYVHFISAFIILRRTVSGLS